MFYAEDAAEFVEDEEGDVGIGLGRGEGEFGGLLGEVVREVLRKFVLWGEGGGYL